MKVKIDTKERFHVITIEEQTLSANMTEELYQTAFSFIQKIPKNVIMNFENVQKIDAGIATTLLSIQQTFYDKDCSLVICNLQPQIETYLDTEELLELMNITPTESEAWDIVQMEEIEREFE